MTTTNFTTSLGLALPTTGDLSGSWGDTVNDYITQYLDKAVAGATTVNTDTTLTKTTNSALGSTSSQYAILIASGHVANITVTAPAVSKTYLVINKSATYTVKVRGAGPTTGVTIPVSTAALVAWDGSDFVLIATTDINSLTGVLSAVAGGTGQSSYTTGDILYASSSTALAKLADVATGNALISGGVGVAPSYGKIGLTTHVSGTLPVANGGTGQTTAQAAMNTFAGAVTSGQYLRGNGTNVVMSAIQVADVPTLNQNTTGTAANVTGTVAVANGGTGLTTFAALSLPVANTLNTITALTATAGQSIRVNAGGTTWEAFTPSDVSGPASSVSGNIATFNGTTGKVLQDSGKAVPAGTIVGTSDSQTLTNKTINGSNNTISNVSLTTAVTGTLPLANGGTGQTTAQAAMNAFAGAVTNAQYLRGNGTNVVMSAIQAADVPTLNQNTTGTAAGLSGSQTANFVYAAPNGAPGTATFRALVAADIPTLNQNTTGTASNVTGTVAVANGGTGLTSFTANRIFYASSTSAVGQSAGLTFDGTNFATTGTSTGTKFIPTGGAATGNGMYLPSANTLAFSTNGTQRMQLNSTGYFKASNTGTYSFDPTTYEFATDSDIGALLFNATSATYAANAITAYTNRAANAAYNSFAAIANGIEQFYVQGDGVIYAQNTTIQSLSDSRLKENVQTATDGLSVVLGLRPVRYDWKEGHGNNKKNQLGFIAQEVEAVFPEAVSTWKSSSNPADPYKTVGPGALIPVLVKAIQELAAEIEALKQR